MSTVFKPFFAALAAITITLNNLANDGVAVSNAIDNSSNLYEEILLELQIAGTAAAAAWLDVRVYHSIDGGTDYGTWESAMILPPVILSATPQVYHARFRAPKHFKIAVANKTGAALSASGNEANYQGVNTQGV